MVRADLNHNIKTILSLIQMVSSEVVSLHELMGLNVSLNEVVSLNHDEAVSLNEVTQNEVVSLDEVVSVNEVSLPSMNLVNQVEFASDYCSHWH